MTRSELIEPTTIMRDVRGINCSVREFRSAVKRADGTKMSPLGEHNEINPSDLQSRLRVTEEEVRKAGRQETRRPGNESVTWPADPHALCLVDISAFVVARDSRLIYASAFLKLDN